MAALAGLPAEYNMIRTIIVARESPITLKEFRAQLLSAERTPEELPYSIQFPMLGMYCEGKSSNNGNQRHFYQGESSNIGANR